LEVGNRADRLDAYRDLVRQTLTPVGGAFRKGEKAGFLIGTADSAAYVESVFAILEFPFWSMTRERKRPPND
jgi:hypothetical protein